MNIETQLQSLTLNSIAELKEMKDQSAQIIESRPITILRQTSSSNNQSRKDSIAHRTFVLNNRFGDNSLYQVFKKKSHENQYPTENGSELSPTVINAKYSKGGGESLSSNVETDNMAQIRLRNVKQEMKNQYVAKLQNQQRRQQFKVVTMVPGSIGLNLEPARKIKHDQNYIQALEMKEILKKQVISDPKSLRSMSSITHLQMNMSSKSPKRCERFKSTEIKKPLVLNDYESYSPQNIEEILVHPTLYPDQPMIKKEWNIDYNKLDEFNSVTLHDNTTLQNTANKSLAEIKSLTNSKIDMNSKNMTQLQISPTMGRMRGDSVKIPLRNTSSNLQKIVSKKSTLHDNLSSRRGLADPPENNVDLQNVIKNHSLISSTNQIGSQKSICQDVNFDYKPTILTSKPVKTESTPDRLKAISIFKNTYQYKTMQNMLLQDPGFQLEIFDKQVEKQIKQFGVQLYSTKSRNEGFTKLVSEQNSKLIEKLSEKRKYIKTTHAYKRQNPPNFHTQCHSAQCNHRIPIWKRRHFTGKRRQIDGLTLKEILEEKNTND